MTKIKLKFFLSQNRYFIAKNIQSDLYLLQQCVECERLKFLNREKLKKNCLEREEGGKK